MRVILINLISIIFLTNVSLADDKFKGGAAQLHKLAHCMAYFSIKQQSLKGQDKHKAIRYIEFYEQALPNPEITIMIRNKLYAKHSIKWTKLKKKQYEKIFSKLEVDCKEGGNFYGEAMKVYKTLNMEELAPLLLK